MKRNARGILWGCGALAIVATFLLYFLIFDDLFEVAVKWTSLLFLVLAEAVLIVKYTVGSKSLIMSAQSAASGVHIVLVLLVSVICILAKATVKVFGLLNVVFLLLLAAFDFIVVYFHNRANGVAKNQSVVAACEVQARVLLAEHPGCAYEKELTEIADMLKYADNTVLTGEESDVMEKLEALGALLKEPTDETDEKAKALLRDVRSLLKTREIYVKQSKRGKF